jgi:hypothetical protein
MPLGLGHVFAVAPDAGVVGADDDVLEIVLEDGLLQKGIKESPRLPRGAGEHFAVRGPILLRVTLKTDGPSESAPAYPAQDAKGQSDGALEAALLREDKGPESCLLKEITQ